MAEELENTSPKAELIKQAPQKTAASPAAASPSAEKPSQEQGKRRKVIVKTKNPASAQSSAASSAAQSKKPKIVVTSAPHAAQATAEPKTDSAPAISKESTPKPPAEKKTSPESKAVDATAAEKPADKTVSTFQITQRPHVVAGRVGGRQVGPRPEGGARPRRPEGAGGRRGGGGAPRTGDGRGHNPAAGSAGKGGERSGAPRTGLPPRQGGGFAGRQGGARPPLGARPGGMQSSAPPVDTKGVTKRAFKAKKPAYVRKDKELEMEEKLHQAKKKATHTANPVPKSIEIMEVISISELARKMNLLPSALINKLVSMGMMVTINEQIDADTATLLAAEYGAEVKIVSLYDETLIESDVGNEADMEPRAPVVTIMGHVDHGKTKLLDAIRSEDVAAGEFGGITQHIGAYTVETTGGKRITFLDTPGHEAFTRMRARGAQVTDIVVLVVAADDGVMPQTIEAVNHAKEANVPIIVAINKIDKPEANPDRVKQQLSDMGLQPEEWGGETMYVEISALKKLGIDELIEDILVQADMHELKANYHCRAEGKVLESRIDPGRGTVASILVENGTLKVGDSFVAGIWSGKVRALYNDKGVKVQEAGPATPIEVTGFDEGIPNAGDPFQAVIDERFARDISAKRRELKRFEDAKNVKKITLEGLHGAIAEGSIKELKVIIKADVQGSAEALRSSLEKLGNKEVRVNVIQALPGAINEGDVELAIASKAILIGFNVRPVPRAKALADQERVDIRKYNVIFKAVEEIQQAMEGMLTPDLKEETLGTAEVRDTFKTPKFGTIAGCFVLSGLIKRSARVHVIRDNVVIHTGKISSLRRFKDDVREVAAGYECGIGIENFNDIQVDDKLEFFEMIEIARKLTQDS